jgi:hypothetical protein
MTFHRLPRLVDPYRRVAERLTYRTVVSISRRIQHKVDWSTPKVEIYVYYELLS